MQKYNAYSRPHIDGTYTVCDNDNPIKVMQCIFTYLARQLLFNLLVILRCFDFWALFPNYTEYGLCSRIVLRWGFILMSFIPELFWDKALFL